MTLIVYPAIPYKPFLVQTNRQIYHACMDREIDPFSSMVVRKLSLPAKVLVSAEAKKIHAYRTQKLSSFHNRQSLRQIQKLISNFGYVRLMAILEKE